MSEDEPQLSKYTRLCIEFKKLREKHKSFKDGVRTFSANVKVLEEKNFAASIHLRNLEKEKESLLFRNQYLMDQAVLLQSIVEELPKNKLITPAVNFSLDDSVIEIMSECNRLHKELASQSEQFLIRIAAFEEKITDPLSLLSRSLVKLYSQRISVGVQTSKKSLQDRQLSSTDDTISLPWSIADDGRLPESSSSENLKDVISSYPPTVTKTQCTNGHINAIMIPDHSAFTKKFEMTRSHSSPCFFQFSNNCEQSNSFISLTVCKEKKENEASIRESLLLRRISQLEHQVAEISLQHHIDLRRSQLARKSSVLSSVSLCHQTGITPSGSSNLHYGTAFSSDSEISRVNRDSVAFSDEADLISKTYDIQLSNCHRQLVMYAGRAAAAHEEIRNLNEHMKAVIRELEIQKLATKSAQSKAFELEAELESTKLRTAQQLSDMAMHMANLSDDMNSFRFGQHELDETLIKKGDYSNSGFSRSSVNTQDKMTTFFNSLLR